MTPQMKSRIEHELDIAKMNAKDLRSSNQLLSKKLDDRNFELLAKEQEIQQLKSMMATRDTKASKPLHPETVSHTHLSQPLTKEQVRRQTNDHEQHGTDAKLHAPRLSPVPEEHLKAIQRLLEDTGRQKEDLRQTCQKKENRIVELEAELVRVLQENEQWHSGLEDCLKEKASLCQKCDYINECYQKLQIENTKVTELKRSVAKCLIDAGFSVEDFMTELEDSGSKAVPPNDSLSIYNTEHSYMETPARHHVPTPEIPLPKSPTTELGLGTKDEKLNNKKESMDSGADEHTIIVAGKFRQDGPTVTGQTSEATKRIEARERELDENEETEDDDDGDVDVEGIASETETDDASEYDPRMDWDMQTESDREISSADDSDYAL